MGETLTLSRQSPYKNTQKAASVQKLLNWFVFFLAFPSLTIFGNSITFFIFIILVIKTGAFWQIKFAAKFLLLGFLTITVIATALAPYSTMPRYPGFLYSVQILTQYAYWILVAAFFIRFGSGYSRYELGKWTLYGVIAASIGFYFFTFKVNLGVVEIYSGASRNGFVFSMLCAIPLTFYYLTRWFGPRSIPYVMISYIFLLLFTDGRSGAIIIILQMALIAGIIYPGFLRITRWLMIPILSLFVVIQSSSFQPIINSVAGQVESISPRFASLLRGEGEGDLSFDKSWLIRKLMIDKSTEIFKEHPILGVGANNFIYYDSKLMTMESYERLLSLSKNYYNSRSAHNSYIQVLSEFGIIGFVFLLFILFIPIVRAIPLIKQESISMEFIPIASLVGIVCHFYAISSITGAISWMVIGLGWASTHNVVKHRFIS